MPDSRRLTKNVRKRSAPDDEAGADDKHGPSSGESRAGQKTQSIGDAQSHTGKTVAQDFDARVAARLQAVRQDAESASRTIADLIVKAIFNRSEEPIGPGSDIRRELDEARAHLNEIAQRHPRDLAIAHIVASRAYGDLFWLGAQASLAAYLPACLDCAGKMEAALVRLQTLAAAFPEDQTLLDSQREGTTLVAVGYRQLAQHDGPISARAYFESRATDLGRSVGMDAVPLLNTFGAAALEKYTTYDSMAALDIFQQNDEGNLIDEFRQNADILSALEKRGVSATVIGLVAAELSERAKSRPPHEEIKPPLPVLTAKQLKEIKEHAKKRPWSKRREFGYAWKANVFEFVAAEYSRWIPGLTQAHLLVDIELHRFFLTQVSRRGLPDWLDVPTERAARIRNIIDPIERAQRLGWREHERHRSRQRRNPLTAT